MTDTFTIRVSLMVDDKTICEMKAAWPNLDDALNGAPALATDLVRRTVRLLLSDIRPEDLVTAMVEDAS